MFFKRSIFVFVVACFAWNAVAQIVTPGTGIHYDLVSLATAYPDDIVVESVDMYRITSDLTLSEGDTFTHFYAELTTILLDPGVFVSWEGFVMINPAEPLLITSADTSNRYSGMDFETTPGSEIHNTSFLYGQGIFVRASSPTFSNCVFANHGHAYRSGALMLSNSNVTIYNCTFVHNSRAAIASAANGSASPLIEACLLVANNTSNGNFPQINLGVSNQATPDVPIRIVNTYVEGLYEMAGGIAVTNLLGSGYSNAVIQNCTIVNNRYGIAQLGGNINGLILNNHIVNNNIEGNPMTGGSGLNFNGTETNTSIVSGNFIEDNLWGVTIQGTSKPSFGRLNDTLDIGENVFGLNGNSGELYALYNNTPDTIWAQNNTWSLDEETEPETVIFHAADDATLGWVIYEPVFIETNVQQISRVERMFYLYPNPLANGRTLQIAFTDFSVDVSNVPYVVIDIRGSVIARGQLNGNSLLLPSSVSSGYYFIGLELPDGIEFVQIQVN